MAFRHAVTHGRPSAAGAAPPCARAARAQRFLKVARAAKRLPQTRSDAAPSARRAGAHPRIGARWRISSSTPPRSYTRPSRHRPSTRGARPPRLTCCDARRVCGVEVVKVRWYGCSAEARAGRGRSVGKARTYSSTEWCTATMFITSRDERGHRSSLRPATPSAVSDRTRRQAARSAYPARSRQRPLRPTVTQP